MIKKILPKNIKNKLFDIKQKIVLYTPFIKKNIILSRNACLGNDILKLKKNRGEKIIVIGQPKARVDFFINLINGAPKPKYKQLKKFIKDPAIFRMIEKQNKLPWLNISKDIKYIVMDSFSELTDKKFTHKKEGWSFCCHYSDINHTQEFKNNFKSNNYLSVEKIEKSYIIFFRWLNNKYPSKKIFIIHYPSKLEKREEYKQRAAKIYEILLKIEKANKTIYNIKIDESIVGYNEKDKFPYHYNKKTYSKLLKKWDSIVKK